jgi:hypothetical protein
VRRHFVQRNPLRDQLGKKQQEFMHPLGRRPQPSDEDRSVRRQTAGLVPTLRRGPTSPTLTFDGNGHVLWSRYGPSGWRQL